MMRFKIQVTEISDPFDGATQPVETEIFKLVVDQFDAVAFTKAVTAQPRRRKVSKVNA